MIHSSNSTLRDVPPHSVASKPIPIKTKNRERSGSDLSNSLVSNDSSVFDAMPLSDTASIASSIPSDSEEHDIDHKYHPPRISSKTYLHQTTETIEEDPDEDSENGDNITADSHHPAVQVTKAASNSRPQTPPSLRLKTQDPDERPVEMAHHEPTPQKETLPVANGKPLSANTLNSGESTSAAPTTTPNSAITPQTPGATVKKVPSFFHLPKLNRSKSHANLPADGKHHSSFKDSLKIVFSINPSTPPTEKAKPSSTPVTPPATPATESKRLSSPHEMRSFVPPNQPPRRTSSVGANMMLNKNGPSNVAPANPEIKQEETQRPVVGAGHKAVNGRATRSASEPPEPGIKRAKTLKECGITSRGKQAGKGATSIVSRTSCNGKVVALKMFKKPNSKESDTDFKRRIDFEFDIAHGLHHPNVIETIELVWDQDKHNWAETMEWCGGGDLYSIIKNGNMGAVERNCCFKQLVRGVAYMHNMGVAHRDIKPENLLLNEEGQLKITDFGVSDIVDRAGSHHMCHGLCGSEPYMAPEVHTHEEYEGFPLDIWGCGVVYVCLAFGGQLWSKAVPEDPGYKRYLDSLKAFEDAKEKAAAKREEMAAKIQGLDQAVADIKLEGHSPTIDSTDPDKASLKSEGGLTRNSSALSVQSAPSTNSLPNGLTTPGSPSLPPLSRENSIPAAPLERKPSNNSTITRNKSFKQGPVVKPDDMVQSPLPIHKAAGAVKGEVHKPTAKYFPFESFQPLQKRLIYRILDPNPETRITAAEILKDPFFKDIQCCSFDPEELSRVQSGVFDASKMIGRKKAMPVKHHHPNHLINGKSKK